MFFPTLHKNHAIIYYRNKYIMKNTRVAVSVRRGEDLAKNVTGENYSDSMLIGVGVVKLTKQCLYNNIRRRLYS